MSPDVQQSLSRGQQWLKENTKRYAFRKLDKEIIQPGICTECGACVSNCPIEVLAENRTSGKFVPTLIGECISCGMCYAICPRTKVLRSELVGDFRSAWKVRSLDETGKRQDGGAVTAFLAYMLDQAIIDSAVVAAHDSKNPWLPVAKLVSDKNKLSECGGTIYSHAPVVQEMMRGYREGLSTICVVGTSCSIDAINNMEKHPAGYFQMDPSVDVIKIGLFCMESFDYTGLAQFLKDEGIDIKNIDRMAISGGKFRVVVSGNEREWSVGDLSPVAAKSCSYCQDLTCKNADISCGNVGSEDGWTTVLIRSIRGENIFQETLAAGLIEANLLEVKSLRIIERIARSKATRHYKLNPSH
ncbi:MAG: Coenzyme F420 hydrogenase/dehydrogenase, beta subunit C-terminal domain [Candidatus Thorarchaeota archaeon]